MEFESRIWEPSQGLSLLRLRRCGRHLGRRAPGCTGSTGRIQRWWRGREVDGAGGGCFVGVLCHTGFHILESKVELDEVGVKDELDKPRSVLQGLKVNSR